MLLSLGIMVDLGFHPISQYPRTLPVLTLYCTLFILDSRNLRIKVTTWIQEVEE